jgi:hypothetical protein
MHPTAVLLAQAEVDLAGGVAVLVFGPLLAMMALHPILSWFGLLPRGDPDAYTQRPYLFLAIPAPLVVGLAIGGLLRLLGLPGFAGVVTLGFLLCLGGLVVAVWGPSWFRPRWQKRQIALAEARREQTAAARAAGHHLAVQVIVADDEREPAGTAGDLDAARRLAAEALTAHATATAALIVDLDIDEDTAVATVDHGWLTATNEPHGGADG